MLQDFTFRDAEEIFAELRRGAGGHGAMKGSGSGHATTGIPKSMHGAAKVHLNDVEFERLPGQRPCPGRSRCGEGGAVGPGPPADHQRRQLDKLHHRPRCRGGEDHGRRWQSGDARTRPPRAHCDGPTCGHLRAPSQRDRGMAHPGPARGRYGADRDRSRHGTWAGERRFPPTATSNAEIAGMDLEKRLSAVQPLPTRSVQRTHRVVLTEGCPSSKQMGLLSVFHKGGSGSSLFDVKPLGVDGSSGGFGWSVFDPFSLFDDGGVASKVGVGWSLRCRCSRGSVGCCSDRRSADLFSRSPGR